MPADERKKSQFAIADWFSLMIALAIALAIVSQVRPHSRLVLAPPVLGVAILLLASVRRPKLTLFLLAGAVIGLVFAIRLQRREPTILTHYTMYFTFEGAAILGSISLCCWRLLWGVIGVICAVGHLALFFELLSRDFRL